MHYHFYTISHNAWSAMFQAIQKAQDFIHLEMFIFLDDTKEDFDFIKLLKQKALEGIKVKMILDGFGSASLSKKAISDLREVGIEIIFLSHLFYRIHKKILVVDNKIAFLGGVNIHKEARNWRDLAVSFSGDKMVYYLNHIFVKDYKLAGGKDKKIFEKDKATKFEKLKEKFFDHFPRFNKFRLKKLYQKTLIEAQKDIVLFTPYFAPNRYLIGFLEQCVLRGVRVKVFVSEKTDNKFFDKANYYYLNKYKNLGIVFYMIPKMNHSKVLFIDNKKILIGSQNFDFLSFGFNSEVGMFIKEDKAIKGFKSILEDWEKEAFLYDSQKFQLSKIYLLISKILDFFVSLL